MKKLAVVLVLIIIASIGTSVAWGSMTSFHRMLTAIFITCYVSAHVATGVCVVVYQQWRNDAKYKPDPLGTPLQRKEFARTMLFGPFMFLFLDPVFKGSPLIGRQDS